VRRRGGQKEGGEGEFDLNGALAGAGSFLSPLHVIARARVLGGWLDLRLARGESPVNSALLSERARLLANPLRRAEMANSWRRLIEDACVVKTPHVRRVVDARVPINKEMVRRAEDAIDSLVHALERPVVAIRGVAMARELLCDGAGPVYSDHSGFELCDIVTEITWYLDPLNNTGGSVSWLQ